MRVNGRVEDGFYSVELHGHGLAPLVALHKTVRIYDGNCLKKSGKIRLPA